jgi:hypothetical protein
MACFQWTGSIGRSFGPAAAAIMKQNLQNVDISVNTYSNKANVDDTVDSSGCAHLQTMVELSLPQRPNLLCVAKSALTSVRTRSQYKCRQPCKQKS